MPEEDASIELSRNLPKLMIWGWRNLDICWDGGGEMLMAGYGPGWTVWICVFGASGNCDVAGIRVQYHRTKSGAHGRHALWFQPISALCTAYDQKRPTLDARHLGCSLASANGLQILV